DVLVGAGQGRAGEIRVFTWDGRPVSTLTPFGAGYTGGLSVAAGDLNGDGRAEIVAGTLAAPAPARALDGGPPFGPPPRLSPGSATPRARAGADASAPRSTGATGRAGTAPSSRAVAVSTTSGARSVTRSAGGTT